MKGLMTLDSNPVPIKAALALRGDIQPGVRLPLVPFCRKKRKPSFPRFFNVSTFFDISTI